MRLKYTLNNATEGEHITTYSPKGWQETELVLARHEKYDGIFLDFTVKVDFFCGAGKEYVDNIYDTQGIEALVTILIEMDCNETDDYKTLYNGQLIMKSYDRVRSAPEYTRFNLEQIGIIQTVLNRLETKVNLSNAHTLDGTLVTPFALGPYSLAMHSKAIKEISEFNYLDPIDDVETPAGWAKIGTDYDDYTTSNDGLDATREIDHSFCQVLIPPVPIFAEVPTYVGDEESLVRSDTYPQNGIQDQDSLFYVIDYNIANVVTITGKIRFGIAAYMHITANTSLRSARDFRQDITSLVLYFKIGGVIVHHQSYADMLHESNLSIDPDDYHVLFPFTDFTTTFSLVNITVQPKDEIQVYFKYSSHKGLQRPGIGGGNYAVSVNMNSYTRQFFDDSNTEKCFIKIEATSTTAPTTAKAFPVFEAGADIARKITNQEDSFRSTFFGRTNSQPFAYNTNGCGSFSAFTNGFQIRSFPISERPIYMSMYEYFTGLNAIHCLGLGIKQVEDNTFIEIEGKEYFYRATEVVLTLNNITSLSTKLDQRYFFSRFRNGYTQWRKDGANGLDEFCTTHEYATLLKSINSELVAQCDFIAGGYAIEKQRREQYSKTKTTDNDYDNDNFIIALNRTVDDSNIPTGLGIAEKNENFEGITNILSPETSYNIRLSPSRSARNWFKILATSVIKLNDTLRHLKFSFAEGNRFMTSKGKDTCDPAEQVLISEGEDLLIVVPAPTGIDFQPLFSGEIDSFEDYPLSFTSYVHLKALDSNGVPNYYKLVRYSIGSGDYYYGFIDQIRYKPVMGKASFVFRRAYVNESNCTHIYVRPGYVECGFVE